MSDLPRYLATLSITLWVGGMWMLGYGGLVSSATSSCGERG